MSFDRELEARHYRTGKAVRIAWKNGVIAHIGEAGDASSDLPRIAPGFVDLQINGFAGIDFNGASLTESEVIRVTELLWEQGVTSYYPTLVTNGDEAVSASLRRIAAACRLSASVHGTIAGIHLEGPFISPHDGARGAHHRKYVKAPDWDLFLSWQEDAEGLVRIITLSPEWEKAPSFISKCVSHGITAAIGHTSATPSQIREAVAAGARMSTHLGNGAHLELPRHPNYIWEQLASDSLWPCAIADGFHLPASVLKVFYRAKPDQLMLVSDAMYLSGMNPGTYQTDFGTEVVLTPEAKLHVAGNPQLLAGSAQMLAAGVEHMAAEGICSFADAWDMASIRPAAFMKLPSAGGLKVGAPADCILFEQNGNGKIRLLQVFKDGRQVGVSSASH